MNTPVLFTIGHSNHALDRFLALLRQHSIQAIADVRFMPYSRYVPYFNPAPLSASLTSAGLAYVHLGKELGARPDDPACYVDGRVDPVRLIARPAFQAGLERVLHGAAKYQLALMCTEKDPLDCHRMLLICRQLRGSPVTLRHILADGLLETNEQAERRLCQRLDLRPTLFDTESDIIEQAYERQAHRIAFRQDEAASHGHGDENRPGQ